LNLVLLAFTGEWWPHLPNPEEIACPKLGKVRLGFRKAHQVLIRPTANDIHGGVVLTVVFPIAHLTNFEVPPFAERKKVTAGTRESHASILSRLYRTHKTRAELDSFHLI
jgi:hypothetical protein